ncbi:MAG TPA: cupin domain-containing protein [Thermoleophilaceae bacterium]|nr:cupin domain-containing protein [Thermoleophilaceae bacterium]
MRRISIAQLTTALDPADPDGFRAGSKHLGPDLGAKATGVTVYDLEPGQAVCPYHYEHGEEEWLLVVAGTPSVRTPEGTEGLEPNDVVFFPTGPEGAHQVRNDSDARARVLMWSNVVFPTSTVYPDSDKVGIYTRGRDDDLIVPRSARVDYFEGESNT